MKKPKRGSYKESKTIQAKKKALASKVEDEVYHLPTRKPPQTIKWGHASIKVDPPVERLVDFISTYSVCYNELYANGQTEAGQN